MSSRFVFIIAIIIVLALGWWFVFGPGSVVDTDYSSSDSGETSSLATTTLQLGQNFFTIEIATRGPDQKRGLGGRESLGSRSGLLLSFSNDDGQGIWMKNMQFPIDILWLDKNFSVVHIEESVSPRTFPEIFISPTPARHVLEVNAGVVEKEGVKLGDTLLR